MMTFYKQSGSALLLALVLLLVLSLLAVSGMQGSLMQERMSSAQREGVLALDIAESGVRDAEVYLEDLNTVASFDGTDGLYGMSDTAPDPFDEDTWSDGGYRTGGAVTVNGVIVTPQYFIEHLGEAHSSEELRDMTDPFGGYSHETGAIDAEAFRVVVRSSGVTGNGQRMIETYYTRGF